MRPCCRSFLRDRRDLRGSEAGLSSQHTSHRVWIPRRLRGRAIARSRDRLPQSSATSRGAVLCDGVLDSFPAALTLAVVCSFADFRCSSIACFAACFLRRAASTWSFMRVLPDRSPPEIGDDPGQAASNSFCAILRAGQTRLPAWSIFRPLPRVLLRAKRASFPVRSAFLSVAADTPWPEHGSVPQAPGRVARISSGTCILRAISRPDEAPAIPSISR